MNTGFIGQNWRGELPLWKAYWLVALPTLLAIAIVANAIDEYGASYATLLIYDMVVIPVVYVWIVVGVWLSARHYTEAKRAAGRFPIWGGLAQLLMIGGVLRTIASYGQVIAALSAMK
jgi:hypothetical protein